MNHFQELLADPCSVVLGEDICSAKPAGSLSALGMIS